MAQKIRSYAIIGALIIMWIAFYFLTGGSFLSPRNLSNLAGQMAAGAIAAVGTVFCLILGQIDLSTDPVVALSGAVIAILTSRMGVPAWAAVLAALLVGAVIGLWQGYWVAYRGIPAFIVTLGGQMLFKGVVLLLTKGATIPVSDPQILTIGTTFIPPAVGYVIMAAAFLIYVGLSVRGRKRSASYGFEVSSKGQFWGQIVIVGVILIGFAAVMNAYKGIPSSIMLVAILAVGASYVLQNTRFGRYVYAIGGNGKASHYSGINNKRNIMIVFVIVGVMTMLSGYVLVSRMGNSTPSAGTSFGLDAIASCVIGGVSLSGGCGTVAGAMVGALLMATLNNGMSLLSMDSSLQYIIKGLILIVAVWFDMSSKSKSTSA